MSGPVGAVIVSRQGRDWAVYRACGAEQDSALHHKDVALSYQDALERLDEMYAAEGI